MRRLLVFLVTLALLIVSARAVIAQVDGNLPPGIYLLEFEVLQDECGHDPFIPDLPPDVLLEIGEEGSFEISGADPWVLVVGAVDAGGTVSGAGVGTVAGFPGVSIELDGQVTEPGVVEGTLAYGADGELPGGCPIIWTLTLIAETPVTTTTTTTTTSTTTVPETSPSTTSTTEAAVVTETTTAGSPSGGGGEFPWNLLLGGGGLLIVIGIWLFARKKGCEEEMAAWLRAKAACDEATVAEQAAQTARDDAETERDRVEDDMDDLCESFPPACSDRDPRGSWAEDPTQPGSRIDGLDVAAGKAWSRALWGKYRDNQMTAQQLEDAWGDPVPDDFRQDYRNQYDAAKAAHDALAQDLSRAEQDLADAETNLERVKGERIRACDAADAARRALDACLGAASGAGTGGGDTGDGGPTPPTGPEEPPGPEEPQECAEGTEREGSRKVENVNVPLDFEPIITGGAAHAAADRARSIARDLRDAEIAADALGRLFSLAPGVKLVREFSLGEAVGVGMGVADIPIPTSPAEAVANYVELLINAAATIIGAVPEWQERRLPDVELTIQWKVAPFQLTCTDVEVCRSNEWVVERRRFTLERTGPDRSGGRKNLGGGFTWAQAQDEIRAYSRRFSGSLRRALDQMKRFKDGCAGG